MISVCLPTKNAGPQFARNLRAWRQQRTEEEFELVVVDSGSRDATLSTARELGARLHTIP
ncbi:MAG: glycosyltransferase, partial [Candidatus Acidoferrales bacterium]